MIFLFCILWGLCATIRESGRKQFDAYFRNLIDGLMKGCSKPAGFKLGRAQMIPDGNLVFDYVTDVSKAGKGSFFNYIGNINGYFHSLNSFSSKSAFSFF